jgi:hypothetical protein
MAEDGVRADRSTPTDVVDDAPASTPARRWRARTVVLGSLLAVGLAGAVLVGNSAVRIWQQKDAELATPDEVAGLRRDLSAGARETAEYLRTAVAAGMDVDASVGAVYEDPADPDRTVLFFGGTGLLFSPGRELDTVFTLLADDGGGVSDVRDVPAGELGGVMKCGNATTPDDGGGLTVCGWADHGSVAAAMFQNRSADESATLLRSIRGEVLTRS